MAAVSETVRARDRSEWRAWLARHAASSSHVWLLLAKKGSDAPSVTYDEAVEEALCFGWIDGQANKWDVERFAVRFSPRRPGSMWAASNKARVEKMIAVGRMTDAGLRVIEVAKARGDWDRLPSVQRLAEAPQALAEALDADAEAAAAFARPPAGSRRYYGLWISDAKRAETRARRVAETLRRAKRGLRWGQPG